MKKANQAKLRVPILISGCYLATSLPTVHLCAYSTTTDIRPKSASYVRAQSLVPRQRLEWLQWLRDFVYLSYASQYQDESYTHGSHLSNRSYFSKYRDIPQIP
jgi:hypothetical protein